MQTPNDIGGTIPWEAGETPAPPDMHTPDYQGGSIVNLMASIMAARGGHSAYAPLRLLPPAEIIGVTNLVLLVIDGLGADYLARHSPQGPLSRHLRGAITSVFPTTTAAAIPSFLTGEPPHQHGLTGWFTWLRELGCVMTVLPGHPRYGGASYRQAGIDPARLYGLTPVFQRLRTPSVVVSPSYIANSDFNRALGVGAKTIPYDGLKAMFRATAIALRRASGPRYFYLYWPKLDTLGHHQGIESPVTRHHLAEIEQVLTDFLVQAAGTDTLVLVTADHGQIDTTPADRIDLADHPTLAQCLALPLCGEPRAAFCYLRPGHVETFSDYCRSRLAGRMEVVPSQDLIDRGLFGLGTPNPRLVERVGDLTLLLRGNNVINQRLPSETPHVQIGVHGGLSRAELLVPLCLLRA
jgi:hypothetical protein